MKKRIIHSGIILMIVLGLVISVCLPTRAMRFYGARVFHCKKSVALKKEPSASAKTICKVKYGKKLDWCYGVKKRNGYYNVFYGDKEGWIKAKYCNFSQESWGLDWATTKVVKCKKFISLRKRANSSSKRICKIPKGQLVFMEIENYDLDEDKYVYVDYRGKRGYVASKYLKDIY